MRDKVKRLVNTGRDVREIAIILGITPGLAYLYAEGQHTRNNKAWTRILIDDGMEVAEVAGILNISETTVRGHLEGHDD